ncbi:hypothetical protein GCM10007987_00060 [Aliivibrio fischeri]|nr:hypothetical protein GCM10007987_00060 [Aliivibrio fischeri]
MVNSKRAHHSSTTYQQGYLYGPPILPSLVDSFLKKWIAMAMLFLYRLLKKYIFLYAHVFYEFK